MAGTPEPVRALTTTSRRCKSTTTRPVPDSLMAGKRFAFMDSFTKDKPKLLGTTPYIQAIWPERRLGIGVAAAYRQYLRRDRLPEGRRRREFNPAPLSVSSTPARRALAAPAWAHGSLTVSAANPTICPGLSCCNPVRAALAGRGLWASGFLPSAFQGVPFRSGGDPILDLRVRKVSRAEAQRETIQTIRDLNLQPGRIRRSRDLHPRLIL